MPRKTPLLSDALEQYLATRVNLAPATLSNDRSVLRRFVAGVGDIQVGSLTPHKIEQYFVGPSGIIKTQKPSSYNKVVQRVAGFLAFCEARRWNSSALLVHIQRRRVMHRERLRLTPAQLVSLLDVTDNARDRCMLAVAMNLGLRASKLTSLQVCDVNLGAGMLHVEITKSGIEDQMPISSDLDPELRTWLTVYGREIRGGLEGHYYLFPSREAPRLQWNANHIQERVPGPWRPDRRMTHPQRVVQGALVAIGLDIEAGEGFHTLRRSAARAFFDAMAVTHLSGEDPPLSTPASTRLPSLTERREPPP